MTLTELDAKEERALLLSMSADFHQLKKFGWQPIMYCPKDGSIFDAIEAGSSGIHECYYEGEWPKGGWWIVANNDLWPSKPILWRAKK